MGKQARVVWAKQPAADDYPAAEAFLRLHFNPKVARDCVKRLRNAPIVEYKAIDLLRAAQLPTRDAGLDDDREKIRKAEKLSPILLVRDEAHGRLIIADGYHRLCAAYQFDEKAQVRCKLV